MQSFFVSNLFWQKEIGVKAGPKMLVKLTPIIIQAQQRTVTSLILKKRI